MKNKLFFTNVKNNNHVNGLITSSIEPSKSSSLKMSEVDKSLHISYCSLAYKLPPNDRQLLATLVSDVIHHTNMSKGNENIMSNDVNPLPDSVTTRIPTDVKEIRKIYLDGMVENYPRQK